MHTREHLLRGFADPVFVHRNSDWSGLAIIQWTDDYLHEQRSVEIPAALLVSLSIAETRDFVLNEVTATLERIGVQRDQDDKS
jgi:hypothetical protein